MRVYYFFWIILFYPMLIYSQVNTEALRTTELKPGLNHTLSLQLALLSGNTSYTTLNTNFRSDYLGTKRQGFFVSSYKQGHKSGSRFINKGFLHLRVIQPISTSKKLELFTQNEYNDFTLLQNRFLVGANLRLRLMDRITSQKRHSKWYIGIGAMLESETVSGQDTDTYLRASNYMTYYWKQPNKLTFSSTTYLQPKTFDDIYILSNNTLAVTLTQSLSLTIACNTRYDSDPPPTIKKWDLDIRNGLMVSF